MIVSCLMMHALQEALKEDGGNELIDDTIVGMADAFEAMYGISA